jgi:hypothetical protein
MNRNLIAILLGVGFLVLSYGACNKYTSITQDYKAHIDSLNKVNDSLATSILISDNIIQALSTQDSILRGEVAHWKGRIKVIHDTVYQKSEEVKKKDSAGISKFYAGRYPAETAAVDTLIRINKPVLVSAAVDLVKYDGAKQEIVVKDSIITDQDSRIVLKDSTIKIFKAQGLKYTRIISNKDIVITDMTNLQEQLNIQNKKLKAQTITQKVALYVIGVGLAFSLIHK